jgi:hypothetical protein
MAIRDYCDHDRPDERDDHPGVESKGFAWRYYALPLGLSRDGRRPRARFWLHEFGFELRLLIVGELVQSQVVCTHEDLLRVQEEWRAALIQKGWMKP